MDVLSADRNHIIHPYAAPAGHKPPLVVSHTAGCEMILADGTALVDGMSSWWAAIHGYNHPHLVAAAKAQLDQMPHVMFGGLTHEPAAKLARALVDKTPPLLQRVFFADSGSVAVEVAIKMALQYAQSITPRRSRLLTIRGGYHGDTFGAMAVCDPINGMHRQFRQNLTPHFFAPRPDAVNQDDRDIRAFEQLLDKHQHCIAAVILEPILQGAGGMWVYRPAWLRRVRSLCDDCGILLIADEIATGFGRTGRWSGCEHAEIVPDILCLGKALTGGVMTLSATLCSEEVASTISSGTPGVLMHGPTFMANPLACRVASANLELLQKGDWQQQTKRIERHFHHQLKPLSALPSVRDVRVIGAVGVIEMNHPIDTTAVTPLLLARKVWLRPFGRLLYSMPPYIISEQQLARITATMAAICEQAAARLAE